jgi:hypothetical protein
VEPEVKSRPQIVGTGRLGACASKSAVARERLLDGVKPPASGPTTSTVSRNRAARAVGANSGRTSLCTNATRALVYSR